MPWLEALAGRSRLSMQSLRRFFLAYNSEQRPFAAYYNLLAATFVGYPRRSRPELLPRPLPIESLSTMNNRAYSGALGLSS